MINYSFQSNFKLEIMVFLLVYHTMKGFVKLIFVYNDNLNAFVLISEMTVLNHHYFRNIRNSLIDFC